MSILNGFACDLYKRGLIFQEDQNEWKQPWPEKNFGKHFETNFFFQKGWGRRQYASCGYAGGLSF